MTLSRFPWFQAFAALALIASTYVVTTQLLHPRANDPGPAEKAVSQRVLSTPGYADERTAAVTPTMISGPGVIEPAERETKVAGIAAGLITRIAVHEGQSVQAGQLLVELEASQERAAVASARLEIENAKRDLDKVNAGERPETIAAASEDLRAATAKAAQSAEILARLAGLAAKDLVTRDEFDRARRQADQDAATAAASRARHAALARGPRAEDVAIQQARIAQAEKKLAEKETALSLRRVLAPAAGTVLQLKYRPGEYYTPAGDPLLLLGNLARRRARIDVDERDIARLQLGTPGYISAAAFPDRRFPAKVVELGQRIGRKNLRTDDPKERIDTKILEVLLELEADAQLLPPGLRITAVVGPGAA